MESLLLSGSAFVIRNYFEMKKGIQIEPKTFMQNFPNGNPPSLLLKLLEFQNKEGYRSYSKWFSLTTYDDFFREKFGAQGAFIPFATANSTGSAYGFWLLEPSKKLEDCPIVFFGDSGGHCVFSENLKDLLQFLALDLEPQEQGGVEEMVFEADSFESENHNQYLQWLKDLNIGNRFKDEADFRMYFNQVQARFKEKFDLWDKKNDEE